jgi:hypothetical protein
MEQIRIRLGKKNYESGQNNALVLILTLRTVQNCPEKKKKKKKGISGIKAHLVTGHIKLPKSNLASKL